MAPTAPVEEKAMIQFIYELKLIERVPAKCSRHRRYNPGERGHT
jgi:hypothetical protein